jgi:hypothetical protein
MLGQLGWFSNEMAVNLVSSLLTKLPLMGLLSSHTSLK